MEPGSKAGLYMGLSVVAILGLVLSLIGNFLWFYWASIIIGIFKVFLVVILIFVEFRQSPGLVKPFSFMFYFLGRGIFYVILGFITMGVTILSLVGGVVIILVGVVYIILHFAKNGHEPEYMSFARYQRLTSGITHDLPTSAAPTYPVAQQIPLTHQNVSSPAPTYNDGSFHAQPGQYNNTHAANAHLNKPDSPLPTHASPHTAHTDLSQEKTEI